jgi:hypothetical protein
MNRIWLLFAAIALFILSNALALSTLSGCASPARANSTQQSTQTIGILVFSNSYTFAPLGQPNSCVTFERAVQTTTSSSIVPVSWNRDSLGAAANEIAYVRASGDVGAGEVYFVFCNNGPTPVTVPAESSALYQVLNPAAQ